MKKILYISLFSLVALSCSKNDDNNSNCNFLLNINVNFPINLNLPQYQNLQFNQQPVLIPNEGNGGIVVMQSLGGNFVAWDNADPSHAFQTCSIMTLVGTTVTCNCDDENVYDINTGQPLTENLACGLRPYRAELSGNNLFISN